jgi:hypothetical protein
VLWVDGWRQVGAALGQPRALHNLDHELGHLRGNVLQGSTQDASLWALYSQHMEPLPGWHGMCCTQWT